MRILIYHSAQREIARYQSEATEIYTNQTQNRLVHEIGWSARPGTASVSGVETSKLRNEPGLNDKLRRHTLSSPTLAHPLVIHHPLYAS